MSMRLFVYNLFPQERSHSYKDYAMAFFFAKRYQVVEVGALRPECGLTPTMMLEGLALTVEDAENSNRGGKKAIVARNAIDMYEIYTYREKRPWRLLRMLCSQFIQSCAVDGTLIVYFRSCS
jgi:hypothetical protein